MTDEEKHNQLMEAITNVKSDLTDTINNKFQDFEETVGLRLDQFDRDLASVDARCKQTEDRMSSLEEERREDKQCIEALVNRVIYLEDHGKRLNLKLFGVPYAANENLRLIVNNFLIDSLGLDRAWVESLCFRDFHRLREYKNERGIILAFLKQEDRNEVYGRAYKLKGTKLVLKVDLSQTTMDEQNRLLTIRKEIRRINPTALAVLTYRSYKPILLVKHQGNVGAYKDTMIIQDLQEGDPNRQRH